MEVELAEKLKEIQKGIEDNQNKQTKVLTQIYLSTKEAIDSDRIKMANLQADNRYYVRLSDDVAKLTAQLKTYKMLFWGTIGTLTGLLIIFLLLT